MTKSSLETQSTIVNTTNRIIKALFPIKRTEMRRFISIALMMFCVLFVQNIVRATKDSIINTLIGVESVSFLKIYGVVPISLLFTAAYIKLVSKVKGTKLFYIILSSFVSFFVLFGFVIFPNHQYLHLNPETTADLIARFPHFKWFITLGANWSFALFYVAAELWPTTVFGLLCWQFINSITTIEQSKRFYVMFGLITQTGMYICGQILSNSPQIIASLSQMLNLDCDPSIIFVKLILGLAGIFGIGAMYFFRYINCYVLNTETQAEQSVAFKAQKKHDNLIDSLKYVLNSKYILLITLTLLCYGTSVNLVEAPWKSIASKKYSSPEAYGAFAGQYLANSGLLTLAFVLIGSNVIRRLGWLAGAMVTPIAMLVSGALFFFGANTWAAEQMMPLFAMQDPTALLIYLGMQHNIVTKSSKYTLFDSTKEMSYVPLEPELKTKGKASADMVGSKLGKSASSFLQSIIFTLFPASTYVDYMEHIAVLFFIVCIVWIYATFALNTRYQAISQTKS